MLEPLSGEKGLAQAIRKYGIKDRILSRWKQDIFAKAAQVFEQPKEVQEREVKIAELERMVGKLTMQLKLQKKYLVMPIHQRGTRSDGKSLGGGVRLHRLGRLRSGGPDAVQRVWRRMEMNQKAPFSAEGGRSIWFALLLI
jgi:transposase-like protein